MERPRFVVVLVGPKYSGNVGAVARALANFGLEDLWLVAPKCSIDAEARRYAMHAWDLLDRARTFATLDECLAELDLAVGTASDLALNEKRDYIRIPLRAREFAERAREMKGRIGLLFGPEDFGLSNEQLEKCEVLVTIPTSPAQPSMNVSHAVAVVAYELTHEAIFVKRPKQASRDEIETMLRFMDRILDHLELPPHRRRTTLLSFRKLLGRAMMSRWEYHRLMGVFNGALRAMEEVRRQGKSVRGLRRVHDQPGRKRPPPPEAR